MCFARGIRSKFNETLEQDSRPRSRDMEIISNTCSLHFRPFSEPSNALVEKDASPICTFAGSWEWKLRKSSFQSVSLLLSNRSAFLFMYTDCSLLINYHQLHILVDSVWIGISVLLDSSHFVFGCILIANKWMELGNSFHALVVFNEEHLPGRQAMKLLSTGEMYAKIPPYQ